MDGLPFDSRWDAGKGFATHEIKPVIVIVDDDESVCRAIGRLVRSLGMDADTFTSGQAFIDLVEAMPSFRVDCVILDVQMPGLNGLQVQEHLMRAARHIPIVFITAHDEAGARAQALAGGAVAFLRKPFTDELLIRTLREAIRRGVNQQQG